MRLERRSGGSRPGGPLPDRRERPRSCGGRRTAPHPARSRRGPHGRQRADGGHSREIRPTRRLLPDADLHEGPRRRFPPHTDLPRGLHAGAARRAGGGGTTPLGPGDPGRLGAALEDPLGGGLRLQLRQPHVRTRRGDRPQRRARLRCTPGPGGRDRGQGLRRSLAPRRADRPRRTRRPHHTGTPRGADRRSPHERDLPNNQPKHMETSRKI